MRNRNINTPTAIVTAMPRTDCHEITRNKLPNHSVENTELNLELEERIPQIRPRQLIGYHTPMRLAIAGQPADFAKSAMK